MGLRRVRLGSVRAVIGVGLEVEKTHTSGRLASIGEEGSLQKTVLRKYSNAVSK